MDPIDVGTARALLTISTSAELEQWLRGVAGLLVFEDDSHWTPVGGLPSNAGSIEASADEINPLVERVVNGMEAVVELKVAELLRGDPDATIPSNPQAAADILLGVPEGQSRYLLEPSPDLTRLVEMTFKGDRDLPTIVVRDRGIGLHPQEFANTVVSLQRSDKGQKPYLIGMYGQGGSSTFDKCEYTVIASRLHPALLESDREDLVGWTIVRRKLETRAHVYSYFIDPDTRDVPYFEGSVGDEIELNNGTQISHIEYRNLGGFANQPFTTSAWFSLNFRLFDPLMPWTLSEGREFMSVTGSRTMRGVPYRLDRLPEGATSVRHNIVYEHIEERLGTLKVEWWVLQDEAVTDDGVRRLEHSERVNPYRDRGRRYAQRRVAITRAGQTHAALTTGMFDRARLRQVARSIVVHVDTNDLTYEGGAGFFASNRADLKTESQEAIERAINAAIDTYGDELRGIERERQNDIIRGRHASDESAIRQRLDSLISRFTSTGMDSNGVTDGSPVGPTPFTGTTNPTELRWARSLPLAIRPGIPTHVDLVTDASDDVFTDSRASLRIVPDSDLISTSLVGGGSGRWRIELSASSDAPISTQSQVQAIFESPGIYLETASPLLLEVEPPPPPYIGNDPPTQMRFRADSNNEVHVRQGGGRITIEIDCQDEAFRNNAATLRVNAPDSVPVVGWGEPRRGQVRVNLNVPADATIGDAGTIRAELDISEGAGLFTQATLVVDERLQTGAGGSPQKRPNYTIIDVRQFPTSESENSWADMPNILDSASGWTGEDVGAFTLGSGDDEDDEQIVFYLNADNVSLGEAERRITQRRTETTVEAVRQYHRTLLCYYLYQMAVHQLRDLETSAQPEETRYDDYRAELIRLNQTLLYAQREFYESLLDEVTGE